MTGIELITQERREIKKAFDNIEKSANPGNIKIKRVTFHGGLPDFVFSVGQWFKNGGYQGFIKDNGISISMIKKVIDGEMSEKKFYSLNAWEG